MYSDVVAYHYVASGEGVGVAKAMYEEFLKLRAKAASKMGASLEYYSRFYPVSIEPVLDVGFSSVSNQIDMDDLVGVVANVTGC